jgi:hypothetical protein
MVFLKSPTQARVSRLLTVGSPAGVVESRRALLTVVDISPEEGRTLTVGYDAGILFFSSCVYAAIPLPCGKNREEAARIHPASSVASLRSVVGEKHHG